jgi:hypothetical protein
MRTPVSPINVNSIRVNSTRVNNSDHLLEFTTIPIALVLMGSLAIGGPAQAATLLSPSNLITNPSVGRNGANVSQLPTNATTYGFTASNGLRLAQSFTVTGAAWSIDAISVMAYLSSPAGGATTSPFTGISINIWDQAPGVTGSRTLAASTTLSSSTWSGSYRTPNGTANLTNSVRPIMNVTAAFNNLTLNPGTYWVDYALSGTSASGVTNAFSPYLLTANPAGVQLGNARQFNGSSWSTIVTTTANQGVTLPLTITGSRSTASVPTPALLPGMIAFGLNLWRRSRPDASH